MFSKNLTFDKAARVFTINKNGEVDFTANINILTNSECTYQYLVTQNVNWSDDILNYTTQKGPLQFSVQNFSGIFRNFFLLLKSDSCDEYGIEISVEPLTSLGSNISILEGMYRSTKDNRAVPLQIRRIVPELGSYEFKNFETINSLEGLGADFSKHVNDDIKRIDSASTFLSTNQKAIDDILSANFNTLPNKQTLEDNYHTVFLAEKNKNVLFTKENYDNLVKAIPNYTAAETVLNNIKATTPTVSDTDERVVTLRNMARLAPNLQSILNNMKKSFEAYQKVDSGIQARAPAPQPGQQPQGSQPSQGAQQPTTQQGAQQPPKPDQPTTQQGAQQPPKPAQPTTQQGVTNPPPQKGVEIKDPLKVASKEPLTSNPTSVTTPPKATTSVTENKQKHFWQDPWVLGLGVLAVALFMMFKNSSKTYNTTRPTRSTRNGSLFVDI